MLYMIILLSVNDIVKPLLILQLCLLNDVPEYDTCNGNVRKL
jgi:hypothetical protein